MISTLYTELKESKAANERNEDWAAYMNLKLYKKSLKISEQKNILTEDF